MKIIIILLLLLEVNGHCTRFAQQVLLCNEWELTASQLDLSFLTPLSVAGCSQLNLRVTQWTTSVALLELADN